MELQDNENIYGLVMGVQGLNFLFYYYVEGYPRPWSWLRNHFFYLMVISFRVPRTGAGIIIEQ